MQLKFLILSVLCLVYNSILSQEIQSPSAFLGYELGTNFTRHHQVVDYFQYLSNEKSDQIRLKEYGSTYEGRPLMLAYISSKENMANLESIRKEHIANMNGQSTSSKAIVWLSYNVHGNESVGTEASMQTVYELLTSNQDYLKNTVVIVDPCVNPDGRERYVNWYYQFKNTPFQIDPNSKEHHEPWLNGRANHYMFDLNRDWAWLTQRESQYRIKVYNQWMPHIHVDFHEQQVDSPYYFAPAAEPFHEVITDFQREFQITVGRNHAKYFDANGWFYFTKEVYDLLYPSYGDTYPMYNGSIGMTYEQGGSGRAGLAITTGMGDTLSLKDRLDHHLTTGLSTLEVAAKNVERLNDEFKKYHTTKNYKYKSYVINGNEDQINSLTKLLDQHQIIYGSTGESSVRGFVYDQGKSGSLKINKHNLVVPVNQKKGTLVKVLFEPNAQLSDSLTYDITAWSLPYAYGLKAIASESEIKFTSNQPKESLEIPNLDTEAYAFLAKWNHFSDSQFLSDVLKADIRVRFARMPFILEGIKHERGTLIITKSDNKNLPRFTEILNTIARKHQKNIITTHTGFVDNGKDFGSNTTGTIIKPKIAVLSGSPTNTLQFGEVWHFFEQQLGYPVTIIDASYFNRVDLSEYNILVMPNGGGYTHFLNEENTRNIKKWVTSGGKLIAMGHTLEALSESESFGIALKQIEKDSSDRLPPYEMNQREQIKKEITGAIFKTRVDPTHPLAYGYDSTYYSLKLGSKAYRYLENGTAFLLEESQTMPVSGFAGSEARKKIGGTLVFGVENMGKGSVVYMVDNPLFRGFWENGKLLFSNALFMVD